MDYKLQKVQRYFELIKENRWKNVKKAEDLAVSPCGYKNGNTPPPLSGFTPFENGSVWGQGEDSHAWFHLTVVSAEDNRYLCVETGASGWDATNPQFIAYINGQMRQGLDVNHREILLGNMGTADVYLYAYTGSQTAPVKLTVECRTLDTDVDGLYYDLYYPLFMLDYLSDTSAEYGQILGYLHRAVSMLELYEIGSEAFLASVRSARDYLADAFYGQYCGKQPAKVTGIGHTHIDCAWLWTLRQTREKVQRSFSTVLALMEQYPEYKFMSSQAFLYQNLKEEAPDVYRRVAEKIQEGRWECEGSMWVEADCNLISGESLVRQILYGKRYFREEFGVETRVLWLPDVFGYSAALPQILKKSGIDWFVTSKISWNDKNKMPYDTFLWQGIDGTEINSYFLTARNAVSTLPSKAQKDRSGYLTTYNAKPEPSQVAGTYERYQQKDLSEEVLMTFGYGDGGGGPNRDQLELLRRSAHGIPGSPQTGIDFAGAFLERMERKMAISKVLPKWQGELYLEFHRGTYTTMAENKKCNRRAEFLYENAELLGVTAKTLFGDSFPRAELRKGWEMILTNQFHDIIPGSSIKEVYDQSRLDYGVIMDIGSGIVDNIRAKIAASLDKDGGYVVFNPHGFAGSGYVKIGGKTVYVSGIAPKGYTVTKAFTHSNNIAVEGRTVETDCLKVVFDEAWQLVSVYDKKKGRELLKQGAVGNELRIHADYPPYFDAWEWNAYAGEEYQPVTHIASAEVAEDGARKGIRIVRHYGASVITQTVWFYDGTTQIDFQTRVDWHERHKMLKAVFPVDIHADKATFDIQFGSIERSTHKNTSWEEAKFEVCAHKYADLSEGDYGVALLNDCKYGYDIHDGVMQLSLLRSPTDPNPEADQGEHTFTYSLYPHDGTLRDSDTVKRAYMLNAPMAVLPAQGSKNTVPVAFSLLSVEENHVMCETVKEAEDGDGSIIRLYEYKNIRGKLHVKLGIPFEKAYLCDMLERELCALPVKDGTVECAIKGFEILTVKVK